MAMESCSESLATRSTPCFDAGTSGHRSWIHQAPNRKVGSLRSLNSVGKTSSTSWTSGKRVIHLKGGGASYFQYESQNPGWIQVGLPVSLGRPNSMKRLNIGGLHSPKLPKAWDAQGPKVWPYHGSQQDQLTATNWPLRRQKAKIFWEVHWNHWTKRTTVIWSSESSFNH
jgi:hypothetical protein